MTKSLIIFILLFSFIELPAQLFEEHAVYPSTEVHWGNYVGLNLNLNYVCNEKYSLQLGYSGNVRKSPSQPEDYYTGIGGVLTFGLANPYDRFGSLQVLFGKIQPLNRSGTIRLNLLGGIGYTTIKEPTNWEPFSATFGSNYSFEYKKYTTLSLQINPKIEFPFTRFFGLTISPILQLSKNRTIYSLGVGHMLGLLRKKNY